MGRLNPISRPAKERHRRVAVLYGLENFHGQNDRTDNKGHATKLALSPIVHSELSKNPRLRSAPERPNILPFWPRILYGWLRVPMD
jgi:hypothetical protein